MTAQKTTGEVTEREVLTRLTSVGLNAEKPKRDVGVDLEVWHPSAPSNRLCIQVKGRGENQTNRRYQWFQIRTTEKQREATVQAGLPVTESWRKKVSLCEFSVLVSLQFQECWVFPASVIGEIVQLNRAKYGNRPDNVRGEHAEMDLDIEHQGKPLTEIYSAYKNNFALIVDRLRRSDQCS